MSYCRWSSDDFRCDVYTYADVAGGYTTHVASHRHLTDEPMPPPAHPVKQTEAWAARHKQVMEIIGRARLEAIGGPHDGETFNDPDPGYAADRLEMLRDAGYHVPQYAIDDLRAEQETPA